MDERRLELLRGCYTLQKKYFKKLNRSIYYMNTPQFIFNAANIDKICDSIDKLTLNLDNDYKRLSKSLFIDDYTSMDDINKIILKIHPSIRNILDNLKDNFIKSDSTDKLLSDLNEEVDSLVECTKISLRLLIALEEGET